MYLNITTLHECENDNRAGGSVVNCNTYITNYLYYETTLNR